MKWTKSLLLALAISCPGMPVKAQEDVTAAPYLKNCGEGSKIIKVFSNEMPGNELRVGVLIELGGDVKECEVHYPPNLSFNRECVALIMKSKPVKKKGLIISFWQTDVDKVIIGFSGGDTTGKALSLVCNPAKKGYEKWQELK